MTGAATAQRRYLLLAEGTGADRRQRPLIATWPAVVSLTLLTGTPLAASSESRRLTAEAYALAYNLRLAESLALLSQAHTLDPTDPAPPRAIAAVTWVNILCVQGVATFAAFEGSAAGDVVARPAVPEALRSRFTIHVEQAIALADRARQLRPHDLDAQYQLAASMGVRALFRGSVEGRAFAAFTEGRKAVQQPRTGRRRSIIPL